MSDKSHKWFLLVRGTPGEKYDLTTPGRYPLMLDDVFDALDRRQSLDWSGHFKYSIERFNETLEYEWLYDSNLSLDPEEFNPGLTEWLIEYNFNRPHRSIGYLTSVEYIERELAKIRLPVLPIWSVRTWG